MPQRFGVRTYVRTYKQEAKTSIEELSEKVLNLKGKTATLKAEIVFFSDNKQQLNKQILTQNKTEIRTKRRPLHGVTIRRYDTALRFGVTIQ